MFRFVVKFVNGVWTIFDRHGYSHGPALRTHKIATSIAAELNGEASRHAPERRR